MDEQMKMVLAAAIDIQKTQTKINTQIKSIKSEALKLNVVIDDKSVKKAFDKQKAQQNDYNDYLNKLSKEYEARDNRVITAKNQKYQVQIQKQKALDKEYNDYLNKLSKEYEARDKRVIDAKNARYKKLAQDTANAQKKITTKSNFSIDKDITSNRIQAWMRDNQKATKLYGKELDDLLVKLKQVDNVDGLKSINKEFTQITSKASANGNLGRTMFGEIKNSVEKFSSWFLIGGVVTSAVRNIDLMITNVKELDASLVELRKVADLSGNSLEVFTDKAYNIGSQIGRTGKDVIDATTVFKRAGYELTDSLDLAKSALIMTNVGDGIDTVTDASSALISVLKGFKMSDTDALKIVDAINETSNNAPIDFANITDGLRRVSGTLSQTGTSLQQTIGLLTGGFGQLRDIEMVSSGLVMISQRLRGIDEDGQAIEGLAPKLAKEFKDIAKIDIEDSNGELRNTYDILSDMARVFPTLSSKQRQYLGELAAGNVALHAAKVA